MDTAARRLDIDPAELRRRNFISGDAFPYEAPAGAIYDSGDYAKGLDLLLEIAGYEDLKIRQDQARASGRAFGIGFGAGVEPSGSNMAYVTLARLRKNGRRRVAGRWDSGRQCHDRSDGCSYRRLDSTPAGQGHETVAAQIVADALGMRPEQIRVVSALDTEGGNWSLASGNYANRSRPLLLALLPKVPDALPPSFGPSRETCSKLPWRMLS